MYRIYGCIFLLLSYFSSFAQINESSLLPFQAQNRQFGYKNSGQQIVIEAQFDDASPFTGNYALVKKNNLWGLINTKGKWVIPASYEDLGWTMPKDKLPVLNGEIIGYKQQGKWGLISTKNKVISPASYDILYPFTADKIKAGQVSSAPEADTLYGIIDMQGKEIISLQYHFLESTLKDGFLVAGINKIYAYTSSGEIKTADRAYGLINWTNTVILPIQYKKVHANTHGFDITPFPSWKLIAEKDSALATYALDSIYAVSTDMYAFTTANKTGLVEQTRILHANKDAIQPEQKGFIVYLTGKKYGVLINEPSASEAFLPAMYDSIVLDTPEFIRAGVREGKTWKWEVFKRETNKKIAVTQQAYSRVEEITDNPLIKVKNNNLYGYISKQGTEIIPLQYDSLGSFMDSVCVAVYKGKFGVLQKNGKWIFGPKADYFAVNKFGYFIRKQNGKYEITDSSGKVKYTSAEPLQFLADGSIAVKQKGKTGRISPTGFPCVPAMYDSISPMTADRTFWAFANKNIYLYKDNGELLIKPGSGIDKIMYVQGHEFLPVSISGKYGFVDGFGRLRIANQYEYIRPFNENLAAVKLAGKWGFVTKQEKIAVQPYYDEVGDFENGKAIARKGDKYGIIDNKGKAVTPFLFDKITLHPTGNYVAEARGKQGMLNKKGFEVIYAKYDEVFPQADDKAIVKLNNKYALLDVKGLIILPAIYDQIIKNPFSPAYLAYEKSRSFTVDDHKIQVKSTTRHK